jgi:hypothetical protein
VALAGGGLTGGAAALVLAAGTCARSSKVEFFGLPSHVETIGLGHGRVKVGGGGSTDLREGGVDVGRPR